MQAEEDAIRRRSTRTALAETELAAPPPRAALDDTGPAAPPRKNGELVFASVWEARLFGLTMALHEAGRFAWDEFRNLLIAEIADWERAHASDSGRGHDGQEREWSYYGCWLRAFEKLVATKKLCPPAAIEARVRALAARPKGHDH